MVKVDLSGCAPFFDASGPDYASAAAAHRQLSEKTGPGAEFTGWTYLPELIKRSELKQILSAAGKIRSRSKTLVVVGIGGSYLGARGAIELLRPLGDGVTRVLFAGNGLSGDYLNGVIEQLGDDDFDVNVISKSGTTLEPALSFRIFRALLEKKYGANAKRHIFATTDANRGVLHDMARDEGWERFVVPDDVGGRYSIFSAVGLLPMAVAGIDIQTVVDAAFDAFQAFDLRSPENPAWQYAAARQHLYGRGYGIELLACYEPSFRFMAEWWKQLYGESEGKNGIGVFPASLEYTADLHSMGQYVQDGPRTMFETVVSFSQPLTQLAVPFRMGDSDKLNYLAGRDFSAVLATAREAVKAAHISGGVPNIGVTVDRRDERGPRGAGLLLRAGLRDKRLHLRRQPLQPARGRAYKKNMFKMLGKPGA